MEMKKRRFYKVGEVVWSRKAQTKAMVSLIDTEKMQVEVNYENGETEVLKLWEIDKLKYSSKDKMLEEDKKVTYFASVEGGIIPTKDEENAGRDCYARLEPTMKDGKEVFEKFIPQFTLAKIPLGFASYLDKKDLLSLKHERSSIGSTGLINVSALIDSTYQGEVILQVVPLTSNVMITSEVEDKKYEASTNTYYIPYGKAIAQAIVIEQSQAKDVHIAYDELLEKPSARGTGGWGSTNK